LYSVSATTRKPRPGEVDGEHYRFVEVATFERMIADGQMLEWANVFGNYYGTPAGPVRQAVRAGKTVILAIDVQGGRQVHQKHPEAVFILVTAPSRESLAERLGGRGTDSADVVARRLAEADREVEAARASGVYPHTVVNDDLETAVQQVVDLIQQE
jgi:guanylate kinase